MMTLTEIQMKMSIGKRRSLHKLFFSTLRIWLRNYRTRKTLKDLPEHLLKDIGRTGRQAAEEGQKPFWR